MLLGEKAREVLQAVTPLVSVVCVLQLALVHAPLPVFLQFLLGALLSVVGMTLLFLGVDLGVLPMGRFIGAAMPGKRSLSLILAVAFALGCATTAAEPDVLVLSTQVEVAAQGTITAPFLIAVISMGVGVFAAIALLRLVFGFSMASLLTVAYGSMLMLAFLAPQNLVPLAFDAGSVTTGVLTAPVLLSLAIGLSSVLAGRSRVADAFGLLGFASVGPVTAILLARLWA